jgi:hypothetical protein
VAEVLRLLRPGGWFLGSVPNSYRLKSRLRFLIGRPPEFADDPTHLRMFGEADVRRLLAPFGEAEVRHVAGRLVPLGPRLFANDIVFRAQSPIR